jgi:hypothetical protein
VLSRTAEKVLKEENSLVLKGPGNEKLGLVHNDTVEHEH